MQSANTYQKNIKKSRELFTENVLNKILVQETIRSLIIKFCLCEMDVRLPVRPLLIMLKN